MTNADDLAAWLDGYVRAWTTNEPADIDRLFADDATYATAPYREPWRGRKAIVAGWLEHRDVPKGWSFRFEILGVAGDIGFVRGRTTYADPPTAYANLFVLRLDADGRCVEFTEWWMVEKEASPPPRHPATPPRSFPFRGGGATMRPVRAGSRRRGGRHPTAVCERGDAAGPMVGAVREPPGSSPTTSPVDQPVCESRQAEADEG